METNKKAWEKPQLETLNVSSTMLGIGTKYIDFVSPSDLDITDTPPVS
ncbi:paeninodin family lasso peptide [Paenibacillus sp. sptzw28]|nr:paeninodin family lasso peptide [Paenibacillus sp. sptzw28]QYR20606.1 paeninodin family lasso peptide [Paenibacillus sp. sptzw28]